MKSRYVRGGVALVFSLASVVACGAPMTPEQSDTTEQADSFGYTVAPVSFATCTTPPTGACGGYGWEHGWIVLTNSTCPDLPVNGTSFYRGLRGPSVPSDPRGRETWMALVNHRLSWAEANKIVSTPVAPTPATLGAFVARYAPGFDYTQPFCEYTLVTSTTIASTIHGAPAPGTDIAALSLFDSNPCSFGAPVEPICVPNADAFTDSGGSGKPIPCMGNCFW